MRYCGILLRRGKPRPRAGLFPDKYRRVPEALKPEQGGQQYFQNFFLNEAESNLKRMSSGESFTGRFKRFEAGNDTIEDKLTDECHIHLPQSNYNYAPTLPNGFKSSRQESAMSSKETIMHEMDLLMANDKFSDQRVFNEYNWYKDMLKSNKEENNNLSKMKLKDTSHLERKNVELCYPDGSILDNVPPADYNEPHGAEDSNAAKELHQDKMENKSNDTSLSNSIIPGRVLGEDFFQSSFGYSIKKIANEGNSNSNFVEKYSQLDLWSEMPKYSRDMVFLYLISRRRNTYAVAYDYEGKRILRPYTVGNRGLKGGDRGFRSNSSVDCGHQVTSMYLNDLIPIIRELRAGSGKPLKSNEKINLVVRVMGFYNGRQGAIRAVSDRRKDFTVRYVEDITPFPLNGPKMPRGVFK